MSYFLCPCIFFKDSISAGLFLPFYRLCSLSSICPAASFTCRHFSEFLRSHHYCKYQIEVLTSGSVFLADILFCESALFYFSEVSGPMRGSLGPFSLIGDLS